MRILVLANNQVGYDVLKWLKGRRENIVGLVVHPRLKARLRDELVRVSGLPRRCIFEGDRLNNPKVRRAIAGLRPDIGVSVLFNYILNPGFLKMFPKGCVNLHPAYLPYNRGQYPNVWSIVEHTPAGVTLHYIDPGIDTGDIIARKRVPVSPTDTGLSLYRKLERASFGLFRAAWPKLKAGRVRRIRQPSRTGTYHRTRDVEQIDPIDLNKKYAARELLDILRARTFPPYKGAYITVKGRRVYLRLELSEDTNGK